MAVALVLYGLFAVTFSSFQVGGDGLVYYNLLRRFFGEHPDFAFAYQFGSDLWNWPFFLVGKALAAIFGYQPRTFHVSFEEISITFATNAAFLLTLYVGWRLLRELDLPRSPAVLFLTVFGSPLFWAVVFDPAGKHAVDTLVISTAMLLVLRLYRGHSDRVALALGALAGVAVNTRYVNVALFAAVACFLAFHRRRAVMISLGAAAVVGGLVFALPALRGISYFVPSYFPESNAARLTAGVQPLLANTANPLNGFDPLIPVKMLFSEHRGLFLWTPLTAFAVLGFVLALRRSTGTTRLFFWTLLGSAIALLCAHTVWGSWDGGFAFSQRFLTSLFPLYLIGIAELRRRAGPKVYSVLILCAAFSLASAFLHKIGYDGISARDGVFKQTDELIQRRRRLPHQIKEKGTARWTYLWALLHGHDPEHVNGP